MNKQRNPDIDWGFYAGIPRVIRTGYTNLTSVQKWLYVCLKDLCGEVGTCYRTIPTLHEETGISTGMISESIPELHKAGLIHAEKKHRTSGGKPVWHITIVDIWQANALAHPTKRSHSEQTQEKNIHTVNDNSTERSPREYKRSQNERERSPRETEVISPEAVSENSIISEAGEEGTGAFAPPARAEISSLQEKISDTAARLKAIGRTEQPAVPDGWQASPATDEELDPEATVKRPRFQAPAQTVRGASEPSSTHSTDGAAPALPSPLAGTSLGTDRSGPRASGAGDGPPPTLTRRQQDRLIEKTFAAYWSVIEAWKGHKYSQAQRGQACHTSGMESMFADGVTPDALKAKLKLLDDFQQRTFTVRKLYLEWWNNLDEQARPATKSKAAAASDESRPRRRDFSKEYEQGVLS